MDFNNYQRNKDIERTLIDGAENLELRKKQVEETIFNSVKACSKAGKDCDKEILFKEFDRLGFPVTRKFIENCLENVKLQKNIIESEGMLWIEI
jgi:hypothetical protein